MINSILIKLGIKKPINDGKWLQPAKGEYIHQDIVDLCKAIEEDKKAERERFKNESK